MLSRLFRQTCSQCGSGLIQWTTVAELRLLVDPAMRQRVKELGEMCGAQADAWHCARCANFGAFAPAFV